MADNITADKVDEQYMEFMRRRRATMRRHFQNVGLFNGHPHMLFHLRRCPDITQKELAREMDISPASVAVSIRRLESAGLVHREKRGREMLLRLTPAGEKMDATCARGRDIMITHLYENFTEEELHTLHTLLGKMTANLQAVRTAMEETI